jgi:hypothetical protein
MEPQDAQRRGGRSLYIAHPSARANACDVLSCCPDLSWSGHLCRTAAQNSAQFNPAQTTRFASSNRHTGRTKITPSSSKHSIGRPSNRHGNRLVRVSNSPTLAHPPALTLLALRCYAEKRPPAPALVASIAKRGLHRAYGGPHGYHDCPGSL